MLDLIILLAPLEELLLASGGLDMLNTHVNALGDNSAIYLKQRHHECQMLHVSQLCDSRAGSMPHVAIARQLMQVCYKCQIAMHKHA